MHAHWPELKKAIEHAIHSAEKTERGGFRIHTSSAERIGGDIEKHSKPPEKDHAEKVKTLAHKAHNQIDISKAVPILQEALGILKTYVP